MNKQGDGVTPPPIIGAESKSRAARKFVARVTIVTLALTAVILYSRQEYLYWQQRYFNYCLVCAARDGNEAMVRYYLWRGENVNQRAPGGHTPLMEAAWNGHASVVSLLLQHGANPDIADDHGNTALIWAAIEGEYRVAQLLVAKGASLNVQNHDGETALIRSMMRYRHPNIAQLLVNAGADINIENNNGETALIKAGQGGYVGMVKYFKQRGAVKTKVFIGPSPFPTKPLPPTRLWALATTAIVAQVSGDSHELLGGMPFSDRRTVRAQLGDAWGIKDHHDAIQTLDWLQASGHRRQYQEDDPRRVRKGTHRIPYLAWDYCRLVRVAGQSYVAGYLTEDEAWQRIMPAARALQANYSSWREMGEDYLAGRERWSHERDPEFAVVFQLLADPKDPNSPWNKNAWNTDLSEGVTNSLTVNP
jgi:uncharacterized protein DUF1266/ankyrin repeat protein